MIDLAIAYRIYPGVSKKPAFFSTDKLKLSTMCLRSFRSALGGLSVKVWAILDGCPPEYEELFRSTFDSSELEIVSLEKIGNLPTFSWQIDLLTKQTEAQFVYFAEDDYFYLPNALEKMVAFMRANKDVDFVTPYDHPDSYNTSSRFERHYVRPFGDRYWRTASSTCLTFLASRETLARTQATFRTYCRGNWDCPVWLSLTQKYELANFRVHWSNLFRFAIWGQTLRWGLGALLFKRRYRLWVPIPTLATHMESPCLSPIVDWQTVFVDFEQAHPSAGDMLSGTQP
jgi:hypothetical protein